MEQQKEDNRYYIPDVEDLRIGSEYQIRRFPEWDNMEVIVWKDSICRLIDGDDAEKLLKDGDIRVPYLTQQQIEELGWEHTGGQLISRGRQDYEKENWILCYSLQSKWLLIANRVNEEERGKYSGECKSINELRYIMKLLKIQ